MTHLERIPTSDPRLGRHIRHDPRSRGYAYTATVEPRHDVQLRLYQPHPLPNQTIGCCTGVDAAVKANIAGNRVKGVVLGMDGAVEIYSLATHLDPWPETYPPDDTGSTGLAAAKASRQLGLITRYEWIFTGAAGIYAALASGRPVGVGTAWYQDMFQPDPTGIIHVSGPLAGGHQWTITGYRKRLDAFTGQCWWGAWGLHGSGRFYIRRADLEQLLDDQGDAHITYRTLG